MPCYKNQPCGPLESNNGMMMMIIMKDAAMVVNDDEDEEDSSITSTVPVTKDGPCCNNNSMDVDDAITVSSCDSSSNDKTQKRKVVHFDESQNKSHFDNCLYDLHEYKSDVWYNALDYQQFKMTTSHIASRIAHASTDNHNNNNNDNDDDPFARSYYKVLLRTYQACCQTAASCGNNNSSHDHEMMILDMMMNDDTNNNNKCIFESATEQAHAQQWIHAACANGALLGVAEKHSIYEIVLDRLHRRMELVSAIFEIQEFCTRHHHATDNDGKAAVAEMMRVASCEKSRPSRLFAQVWAQAVL